MIVLSLLLMH